MKGNVSSPNASDPDGRLDLAALIDHRPMSAIQKWVVMLCAAAIFVDGYDIQVMALAVPSLAKAWSLPPSNFGLALSAVVVGLSFGAAIFGPLGDRIGRRKMLILSMLVTGFATCLTATATSPMQFVIWRLLTGLALGACIPNCGALTSEYSSVAHRSVVMGLLNVATPVGATLAAYTAPAVLAAFGWHGTFIIGGIGPLAIAFLAIFIPESLKFLLVRQPGDVRIAKYIQRIAPDIDPRTLGVSRAPDTARASVGALLSPEFRARTFLLWCLFTLNLFTLYVLISWVPTLLAQAGWSLGDSLRGAMLVPGGGIAGGLLMARLMDRGATKAALVGGLSLATVSLALFTVVSGHAVWGTLLLLVGAGASGSQLALNALSAAYYPSQIKATGLSWTLVAGGVGSIAGPMAGASLIDTGLSPAAILAGLAVPSVICVLAVAFTMRSEWQAH